MSDILKFLLIVIFKQISNLIPKKKNLILITADRYNENSRYLYEYLLDKNDLKVYWLCNSIEIKNYLESILLPCIYGKIISLYYVMRCKVIITSGTSISYLGISNKTIKYTLWHGTGIKQTEYINDFYKNMELLSNINSFDYINFTSNYTSNFIAKVVMKIPSKKIVVNGYPRFDQLLNLQNQKDLNVLKNKYINDLNLSQNINNDTKLLIYTPTWRNKDKNNFFPMLNMNEFNIKSFNDFLNKNNHFLFYTTHPNSVGYDLKYSNIKYLDYNKLPTFDLTNFFLICDILINDYSTTALEFALMKKKQISLLFDHQVYFKNSILLDNNIKTSYPGKKVYNYNDLIKEILYSGDVIEEKDLIDKFYDKSINNSCEKNYEFIKGLLK